MGALATGLTVLLATLAVLMTGMPVAFALGLVSVGALIAFEGIDSIDLLAESFFGGLDDFTLVSIPMFVLMGAAVASSRAGKDLYEALDRWLYRVPGGLVISNLGACSIFAALTGSSPATCAAIGKMGIPEMRRRGYPDAIATGSIAAGGTLGILIPPSLTFILYGIATETSIGRLFLAGAVPGVLLTALFMAWTWFAVRRSGFSPYAAGFRYSWREKFESLPKVLPFLAIVAAVMWALYGGVATPSEAAGVGALFCVVLAVVLYRMWRLRDIAAIFRDTTRESVMILMIIGTSILFGYMLTSLYLTQSLAEWIAALEVNRWVLMAFINLFLLAAGCFLPPAAIILMTAPILMPIVTAAGFDPVWFGVVLTINMEVGLITPPVGLNLYVINGIARDVPLQTVMRGALPYVGCMILSILLLCLFPGLATWLPDAVMGPAL
ncbi:TRAP transporter large permease [Azospirillum sp. ST 5-10]|uniref:TRAP transporter large permease n=1 Tax=unclassified Azospirillum TaxID=2630922 RepID=UPI003F4A82C3